jgi:hypothetical protein
MVTPTAPATIRAASIERFWPPKTALIHHNACALQRASRDISIQSFNESEIRNETTKSIK